MRSPLAAAVGALLAGAAWFFVARRDKTVSADLEAWWFATVRHASRTIGALALVAAIIASTFATRSAAGADASGYLSQAEMWSHMQWRKAEPLDEGGLAPRNQWLTTPLGWRPASPAYQAPTYPPGLPLLMAVPHAVAGVDGATALIVASAAAAVWGAGMLARGTAGIIAAVLLACAPAFLNQSIQPMSDVPVTAAWVLCFLLLDKPSLAGVACALAVLIRPNLAPLAVVPLLVAPHRVAFALPVAAAGTFLAFMQWHWYGSPLRSGYGTAEELFTVANIWPNLERYAQWLIATAPVLIVAPLGLIRARQNRRALAIGVFAALVIAAYLVYAVFDQWSYLRFLLPALAVFAVFAGIELAAWVERSPIACRAPLLTVVLLAVSAHGIWVARSLDTFKLGDQLRRVRQVADYLNQSAPPTAVIVSGEQSGSMRYYTGRSILRWEAGTPDDLAVAIETLVRVERSVYIALDAWEEELFRKKFASIPAGQLDWPSAVEAGESHRTKLWRVGDRARFLAGARVETLRLP